MLLSKSCMYGLRAALYLASQKNGNYVPIRKMSEELDISFHFLTKILQELSRTGLMESYKGPNGGIRLSKPGTEISILDIVTAIDGGELFTDCVLGLPGCGTYQPCPLHETWAHTRDSVKEMLGTTTLADLTRKGKQNNLRLTATGEFRWE